MLIVASGGGAQEPPATGDFSVQQNPAFAMIEEAGEARKYWPRWRGPSGQGFASDNGYPERWSTSENLLWKVEVPGYGGSLTTAYPRKWNKYRKRPQESPEPIRRSIVSFRRTDGKLLWETFVPDTDVPVEAAHWKNGWATPTPTTDGDRVYAYFGNHGVIAVDFHGKLIWSASVGQVVDPRWDYGVASSLLLYRDRLIIIQDHEGTLGPFIMALDKSTGRRLWLTPRTVKTGWSTPVAVRAGDHDEMAMSRS